jgi:CRP-like cAMP-binding protein
LLEHHCSAQERGWPQQPEQRLFDKLQNVGRRDGARYIHINLRVGIPQRLRACQPLPESAAAIDLQPLSMRQEDGIPVQNRLVLHSHAGARSRPGWCRSTNSARPRRLPKTAPERALDLVDLFSGLTEEERKLLAGKTKHRHHDAGETLAEPGQVVKSLLIVGAGVLSFTSVVSQREIEILRIGPGDHFGEIGMLTGHAAQATVKALTPTTTYEVSKEDLTPVLEARPEVSTELCRALARRQAAGKLLASTEIDNGVPPSQIAAWFSERLHRLFDFVAA